MLACRCWCSHLSTRVADAPLVAVGQRLGDFASCMPESRGSLVPCRCWCGCCKHRVSDAVLLAMREDLVGYIMAAGVVHRVDELFSLFDRPTGNLLEHCLRHVCTPAAEDGTVNISQVSSTGHLV